MPKEVDVKIEKTPSVGPRDEIDRIARDAGDAIDDAVRDTDDAISQAFHDIGCFFGGCSKKWAPAPPPAVPMLTSGDDIVSLISFGLTNASILHSVFSSVEPSFNGKSWLSDLAVSSASHMFNFYPDKFTSAKHGFMIDSVGLTVGMATAGELLFAKSGIAALATNAMPVSGLMLGSFSVGFSAGNFINQLPWGNTGLNVEQALTKKFIYGKKLQ